MIINGIELEFNVFDADQIELLEKEAKKTDELAKNLMLDAMGTGEAMRATCKIHHDFFNAVFGEGTAEKLFAGKNDIKKSTEAIEELFRQIYKEQEQFEKDHSLEGATARLTESTRKKNRKP